MWSQQHFKCDIFKLHLIHGFDILDFNTSRFGRLAADWSVENKTPDMTMHEYDVVGC